MLMRVVAIALLGALISGQVAAATGKPDNPANQPGPNERESDSRADRDSAPPRAQPVPGYPAQAQPQARYVVLTEQQKRCGMRRQCDLDSRVACPPCW